MITDHPVPANNALNAATPAPTVVGNFPSLASIAGIPHITILRPCLVCPQQLSSLTSRSHYRGPCGEWIQWGAYNALIARETNASATDSVTSTRIRWTIEHDAQDLREQIQAMIALEESAMAQNAAAQAATAEAEMDAEMDVTAEGVATLELQE
ncbi:hypothetical protein RhiJN_05936 [Ceratobasidium sp. AG-Ba]|nr:hypothetical protein RhiJN_05936 [Ceratobasidium sp. AG-Ba]QRW06860.1 hypothetical protein RhiLY_05859 [Ceratobasidium sp. AG-Ba]